MHLILILKKDVDEVNEAQAKAQAYLGVSTGDSKTSPEDAMSTPLPGETLAQFYNRSSMASCSFSKAHIDNVSGEYWASKAFAASEERGKELRRGGFSMAQERYGKCLCTFIRFADFSLTFWNTVEYKPTLDQIEKILAEAGLDEEEIKRGAAAGPPSAQSTSRNRR